MTETTISAVEKLRALKAREVGPDAVMEYFRAHKAELEAVMPRGSNPDRLLQMAIMAVRQQPVLTDCTVSSLFGAVMACATIGLEPGSAFGHVTLIPFADNRTKRLDVQVIIGARGLVELVRRSGAVLSIHAYVAHQADEFDVWLGTERRIIHKPSMDEPRGPVIAAYAVAHMASGGTEIEFMTRAEINRIMSYSMTRGQSGPWRDHFSEMARKTVLRRLCKYMPMSREANMALAIDGQAVTPQDIASGIVEEEMPAEFIDGEEIEIVESTEVEVE